MLKFTKAELELLHDVDMYNMIEQGIRGGICRVSKKHLIANNKCLSNYDKNKKSTYIMYLDANNLYGLAMSFKLPYNKFKWNSTITEQDILNYDENSKVGYILKVDLEYPEELHDLHKDYPLLSESRKIKESEVSDVSKQIYKSYTNKDVKDSNCSKLILDFNKKKNYVVHIANLKYYLQKGIKLKRIAKCIQFNQTAFL